MKQWLRNNRGILVFFVALALFRTAVADWNPVPTGSMRPTILEGDVVLVDRLAYDVKLPLTDIRLARLGEPRRGDIVTFSSPKDGTRLIKRLVAVPGDIVELRGDVLVINGEPATYSDVERVDEPAGGATLTALRATEQIAGSTRTIQVFPHAAARRGFGPATVPADHYFMLGDNRDNSEDSRWFGFVPRERLIGRAGRILVSADIKDRWQPRFGRTAGKLE